MIAFHCAKCGERLDFSENMAGHSVPCPSCREWVSVPKPVPASDVQRSGGSTVDVATNGKAIASLVLGLVAFCIWPAGIVALILGTMAKGEIDGSGGRQKGEGLAIWGIVLGVLGAVLGFIIVVARWNEFFGS